MECAEHPYQQVIKACFSCGDALVCKKCVDGTHHGHTVRYLEDIGKERKQSALQYMKETRGVMSEMIKLLENLEKAGKSARTLTSESASSIQRRGEELKEVVDKYTRQLVKICEKQQAEFDNDIENTRTLANAQLDVTTTLYKDLEMAIKTENYAKILIAEKNHRAKDHEFRNYLVPDLRPLKFAPGHGRSPQLRKLFGDLEQVSKSDSITVMNGDTHMTNVSVSSSFDKTLIQSPNGICSLCPHPLSDDQMWIRFEACREVFLADRHGSLVQTVSFDSPVACFTTTPDNRTIVACPEDGCLQEILPNGDKRLLFTTDRLIPRALCTASEGNLVLSLVEKWTYSLTPSSIRKIARFNMRGHKKEEAEYDSHRQRLFIKPSKIAANKTTGDLTVINWTEYETSHLVVLDNHLQLKFRYLGHGKTVSANKRYSGKTQGQFCPHDVCYDTMNNILISELYSGAVQILSGDGKFLKILHSDRDIPCSIALHRDDQLWVGYDTGKITVLKYTA